MNGGVGQAMGAMRIERLRARLEPVRAALSGHPVYREIDGPAALRLFMEHHVFAVWDFMSLLKALQQGLCCNDVPWLPPTNHASARLVNEIVLAEESDEDGRGGFTSHFALYVRAMAGFGADTSRVERFLAELRQGSPLPAALNAAGVPGCAREFVRRTFAVIESGDLVALASTFTFGREDLLPDLFRRIVDELGEDAGGGLVDFRYYLHRHIGLDGDEHGPMATTLVESLCGDDERRWEVAERAAVAALEARLDLWNGMRAAIRGRG
jgi:Protein of unknown function (DUF3050)